MNQLRGLFLNRFHYVRMAVSGRTHGDAGVAIRLQERRRALEEVRALAARKLDPSLPAMKAHGVPWLIRHFNGEITLDAAAEGGKRDTRRYTKRQGTWFRHQLPEFVWVEPKDAERTLREALSS